MKLEFSSAAFNFDDGARVVLANPTPLKEGGKLLKPMITLIVIVLALTVPQNLRRWFTLLQRHPESRA
jgi:hypothetical protein